MDNIDIRFNFAMCKCRNIIYYMSIEDRPRATYIHIVRDLRKTFVEILENLQRDDSRYDTAKTIVSMINPKVRKENCYSTMMEINKIFKFQ